MSTIELALDTDIGSDVDDLLALALIFGSPEVDLRAVTTVYGDTALRARIVHRAHALAGRPAPPIAAGERATRSGRPVWWAGHEGVLMPGLDAETVDESLDVRTLLSESGTVAAIGPLTNAANAVDGPHRIDQLVIMGGDFAGPEPEHNVASDVTAAQLVFRSGVPAVVTGIDQTERVVLDDRHVADVRAAGPLGRLVADEIVQFRAWLGRPDSPHDAVAVLAALRPELFTFAVGTVEVDDAGHTSLNRRDGGPHQVVVGYDADAVLDELAVRINRGSRPVGAAGSPQE